MTTMVGKSISCLPLAILFYVCLVSQPRSLAALAASSSITRVVGVRKENGEDKGLTPCFNRQVDLMFIAVLSFGSRKNAKTEAAHEGLTACAVLSPNGIQALWLEINLSSSLSKFFSRPSPGAD